jgi:hypothetical protein
MVASMSSLLWAAERNAASNCEQGRKGSERFPPVSLAG